MCEDCTRRQTNGRIETQLNIEVVNSCFESAEGVCPYVEFTFSVERITGAAEEPPSRIIQLSDQALI